MPKVSADHLAARRRQILDAAARCFARDGFHATSVHDIVRESGISAGLVYRYFTGKDDMIVAIVAEWHEQRRTAMESARFTDLADAYLGLLRSIGDPETRAESRLGVQVWAEALRSSRIMDLTRDGIDGPRKSLAARVRSAQAGGGLPADLDPDAVVRVFVAIYQGLVLQTALDDGLDHDAFVRAVEGVLDALVRRPAPRPGDADGC